MAVPTESRACLVVFAKTPVRGKVKTRMRSFLSEEDCLRLHCLLLQLWIGRLRDWDLHHATPAERELAREANRKAGWPDWLAEADTGKALAAGAH